MEIKRPTYLKKMIDAEGNGLIKIITGMRRSGKSYLLNNIFLNYLLEERGVRRDHIIDISFETYRNDDLKTPESLGSFVDGKISGSGKYYILLDEIQEVSNFESVLSDFLMKPNVEIYATGSNSKFLSSDIITEFRGRSSEIRVYPLSFSEFLSAYTGGSKDEAWREYWSYGGLPLILSQKTPEAKINYLNDIQENTYLKDVVQRNSIKNSKDLRNIYEIISSMVGALTNPLNLANVFKTLNKDKTISDKTVYNYLGYLEDAFLIEQTKRFDVRGRGYISTPQKYYFTDPGVRNSIIGFRQNDENHVMENIVYTELRRRGYLVDVGVLEVREKGSRKQLEIDFVANKETLRLYIQVALTVVDEEKLAQETRPLNGIENNFRKILITGDNIERHFDENGIEFVNILDFLCEERV